MTELHTPEQPYPGQPVVQPSLIDPGVPQLVGYARVSTRAQDPGPQITALEAAGCSRVYVEHASGAKSSRPELAAALDYLRAGDTLVCTRFDRLGRSIAHFVHLVDQLRERGVNLRSLNEGADLSTPTGRMMAHLFALLAEMEREWNRERTAAAIEAARLAGRKGGQKPKLTGKRLETARALLDDDALSVAEVARRMGVSRATVHRSLPDEIVERQRRRAARSADSTTDS